jgi:exodeoxyribonuclease VII small subunit
MMQQPVPEPAPKTSFEEYLQRVQTVVEQLESGNLPLEKSLELFTEGVALVRQCQEQLTAAEQKVEFLVSGEKNVSPGRGGPNAL